MFTGSPGGAHSRPGWRYRAEGGQGGVTHLGMEMAYQVQQLLHTPLQGQRLTPRVDSQCQGVRVQPGEVANYSGIRGDQVDALSAFVRLCVHVGPVEK